MAFRNGDILYFCDNECELCEGRAYVVTGMTSIFDKRKMELIDVDIKKLCPNAKESDELI